ncbi:MAG: potassium channel protein [Polyangiaceae bacterium]|nr:potassium channel protein [Polyangiaceae bacterium]
MRRRPRYRWFRVRLAIAGYVLRRLGPPLVYAALYLLGASLLLRWDLRRHGEAIPDFATTVWSLWTLLVFEPTEAFPHSLVARGVYWFTPLAGLFLLAQGVFKIGASLLDLATQRELWTSIMTDMMNKHVVVCGLGHVGYRVSEELCQLGEDVVAIEQSEGRPFIETIRAKGVPVLVGDARRDELLVKVGVARAKAIVCATGDDLANLEIALDAKRMNPNVRVVMRMFDQRLAGKVGGALELDESFSTSALSAPLIAIQATHEGVHSAYRLEDVVRVTADVVVGSSHPDSAAIDIEERLPCRIVSRKRAGAEGFTAVRPKDIVHAGDTLIVDCAGVDLAAVRFQLG